MRHFTFRRIAFNSILGGDGDTPQDAWFKLGLSGVKFLEWSWYEVDGNNQPVRGFNADGLPFHSHGPEPTQKDVQR